MIVLASVINKPSSVVGAESVREIIEMAAGRGDYQTARDLLNHYTNKPMNNLVLGAESELEDKVYPERSWREELELETC
jgi:hypothetical protein